MASAVDICNLALSHLGDGATVVSIDPPEGSAQAEHCARYYPLALEAILEMHPWSFATTRERLAQVDNPSSTWAYAYAQPSDALNLLAILDPNAPDDYSGPIGGVPGVVDPFVVSPGIYTPQPFAPETLDADGSDIILTNQADAVLRYTRLVTDTAKFTPLFRTALSWLLASHLAGPVLKGDTGRAAARECIAQFNFWFGKATDSDASQRRSRPAQQVGWVNARA